MREKPEECAFDVGVIFPCRCPAFRPAKPPPETREDDGHDFSKEFTGVGETVFWLCSRCGAMRDADGTTPRGRCRKATAITNRIYQPENAPAERSEPPGNVDLSPSGYSAPSATGERDCKHGQLARQCDRCELEAENARIRAASVPLAPLMELVRRWREWAKVRDAGDGRVWMANACADNLEALIAQHTKERQG